MGTNPCVPAKSIEAPKHLTLQAVERSNFGGVTPRTLDGPGHPTTKPQRYQRVVVNTLFRIRDGCSAELVVLGQLLVSPPVLELSLMEVFPGVSMDPDIRFGKPCLSGTRIDVATIVGALAAGESAETVAAEYALSLEQVRAALAYVAHVAAHLPPAVRHAS
jgi:uncharacterized protein (DUF433 family)